MKILVLGKKQQMHWPEKVSEALRAGGHDVSLVLYNKHTFSYCFHRVFHRSNAHDYLAKKVGRWITEEKPDLILFVSCFFIPKPFYTVAKKFAGVPKVGWAGDAFGPAVKDKADCLNILFCSDTGYMSNAKNFLCKVKYLPLCADPKLWHPADRNTEKGTHPFMAGIANPERNRYLAAIQTPCLLYGLYWDQKKLPQHIIHNHLLAQSKVAQMVAKAPVALNLCFSKNIICGLNFRVFEIGCAGGLILVNAESTDISLCYQIGTEALVYHSPAELDSLVRDILARPGYYDKIREAGYRRTIKDHTFEARLTQMLSVIKQKM